MDNISIIIPVYNEEESLGSTLAFFDHLIERHGRAEIIVVNDGSNDKTKEILNTYQTHKKIKIITHATNRGYGASLKTGVQHAQYDFIAITDCDGSYPNEKIPELYETLRHEHVDMIVGERTGKIHAAQICRQIAKSILRKLAEYLSGRKIPDLNSGLRIIRKDLVRKYERYLPDGFSFTTTITLLLLSNNHSILYVPIQYNKRQGKSKIRPIHDTMNFFQLILRTVMLFEPLKVFLPISVLFIVLAALVFIGSYIFLDKILDVTVLLLFFTGLQVLAIGLLADLIDKRMSR